MADRADEDGLLRLWRMFGPPLRPGPEDMAAARELAPSLREGTALILGATPELVDLAIERGAARVYAVDSNEPIFGAMRRLAGRDWSKVVPLVEDWRNLREDLCPDVDLALGDGSFCLVDFPDGWKALLGALKRCLKPSGTGIFRTMFNPVVPLDVAKCCADLLARFDEQMASAPPAERLTAFRRVASTIRLVTIAGAAGPDGQVDVDRRGRIMTETLETLSQRYGGSDVDAVVQAVFGTRREMKGGRIVTLALPRWEEARKVIEECGYSVAGARRAGPSPGCDIYCTYAIRPEGA